MYTSRYNYFLPLILFFFILNFNIVFSVELTPGMKELIGKSKREEEGLDLANIKMKMGAEEGAPNIHAFLGCEFCHLKVPEKGFEKEQTIELVQYNSESGVCETCHAKVCIHPSEFDPGTLTPPLVVPTNLPLGKFIPGSKNKITCLTCHFIHGETFLNQLIRGFPMNLTDTKNIFYKTRLEFCAACHAKSEDLKSDKITGIWEIHKSYKDGKHCSFCHKTDNAEDLKKMSEIQNKKEKEQKIVDSLRTTIKGLCSYCHIDQAGKQHFRAVNAFADKNLKSNLEDLGLPLIKGKFTCITCHESHGSEKPNASYLRSNYLQIISKSNRINPHRRKDFCLSCHLRYDENKKVVGLKFNADLNKICNWCHDGKEARADVHPVNVVLKENEYMKKPPVPLAANDKLTCYSCHYTGYGNCEKNPNDVKRAEDLTNKNHLRGWPYEERWDQCYFCHVKKEFKKFNAHYQLDSTTGKIIEESCLFCHSSRPEINIEGMEKVKFKGVVVFICLGCHPDTPHPGRRANGEGVNHMVKPIEVPGSLKIPDNIPLSDRQRLNCGSCHNPHTPGVLKAIMGKGAGSSDRKRFEKCTDCHISK